MEKNKKPLEQLINEPFRLLKENRIAEACELCNVINKYYPTSGNGWHLTSVIAYSLGNVGYALQSCRKALDIEPNNLKWRLQKAYCLEMTGYFEEAKELALEIASKDTLAGISQNLAMLFNKLGIYDKAEEIYQKVASDDPKTARNFYNLAAVQQYLGKLRLSEASCNKAIELDGMDYDAYFLRSNLKTHNLKTNHIAELNRVLKIRSHSPIGEAQLQFALAKELEDCDRFEESFVAREKGANRYRSILEYDVADDVNFNEQIRITYNKEVIKTKQTERKNTENIFVLGMPRSGSTLIERVLSGHDQISSAGELRCFSDILSQLIYQNAPANSSRVDMVTHSVNINFSELGERYQSEVRRKFPSGTKVVDKFPQNSLYIGLILNAMPQAKVILTERHPIDLCYAIYKQLFTNIYQFSYRMDELAEYYLSHYRLMEHWKKLFGERLHVVKYEDMISNFEITSRSLMQYCGVDWQQQVLDFTRNKSATTTASASQVRNSLYTSSLGKWKNYESQLQPLIQKLNKSGCLDLWEK